MGTPRRRLLIGFGLVALLLAVLLAPPVHEAGTSATLGGRGKDHAAIATVSGLAQARMRVAVPDHAPAAALLALGVTLALLLLGVVSPGRSGPRPVLAGRRLGSRDPPLGLD